MPVQLDALTFLYAGEAPMVRLRLVGQSPIAGGFLSAERIGVLPISGYSAVACLVTFGELAEPEARGGEEPSLA